MEKQKILIFDSNEDFCNELKSYLEKHCEIENSLQNKKTKNDLLQADILVVNTEDILLNKKVSIIPACKKNNKRLRVILLYPKNMPELLDDFVKEAKKMKGVFFNYLICKDRCTPKYLANFINSI
jgi:hypothetical protein